MDSEQNNNQGMGSEPNAMPMGNNMGNEPMPQSDPAPMADMGMGADSSREESKTLSIIGYVVPILFFLPLLSKNKSAFARFHANQQLVVLIVLVAIYFASMFMPVINMLSLVVWLIAMIMGIMNVTKGKMTEIPLIGKIHLIK